MIKFENTQVTGWEPAIRGMRNPMNSWDKSDSEWKVNNLPIPYASDEKTEPIFRYEIGPNDHGLMERLNAGGSEHAKYRRMIVVYVDVTAPLYWWKEMDTYKVGTVANSCSTMHKIQAKEFTLDDFSCEHLDDEIYCCETGSADPFEAEELTSLDILKYTLEALNFWRKRYNILTVCLKDEELTPNNRKNYTEMQKYYWWQMIQLLPTSYNQKRTLMLNYEVLSSIYRQRKGHKLDEWHEFREWIESLSYSELITGEREKSE